MVEVIHALNTLTWPGAFAFAALCFCVCFGIVAFYMVILR